MTGTGKRKAAGLRWAATWIGLLLLAAVAWAYVPSAAASAGHSGPPGYAVASPVECGAPHASGSCVGSICSLCPAVDRQAPSREEAIPRAGRVSTDLLPEDRSVPPRRRPPKAG